MPFTKGHKLSKGRPKKVSTQVKDWIKEHPYAVAALMQSLYDKGIKGDRESAMYIIDRIKGKPTIHTDITSGDEVLGVGTIKAVLELIYRKRMELMEPDIKQIGGNDALQEYTEAEGSSEEGSSEA